MQSIRGQLLLIDDRYFCLERYQLVMSRILVRGYPDGGDRPDHVIPGPMLDLLFTHLFRISLPTYWRPMHLRLADEDECAQMVERYGEDRHRDFQVFLLKQGSIEDHVIAGRVYWAEFGYEDSRPHPLWTGNNLTAADAQPLGTIYYV